MSPAGSRQLVEQRLCLIEVRRVEAFGKPAVDRGEDGARVGVATLIAAQPGETDSRTQGRYPA